MHTYYKNYIWKYWGNNVWSGTFWIFATFQTISTYLREAHLWGCKANSSFHFSPWGEDAILGVYMKYQLTVWLSNGTKHFIIGGGLFLLWTGISWFWVDRNWTQTLPIVWKLNIAVKYGNDHWINACFRKQMTLSKFNRSMCIPNTMTGGGYCISNFQNSPLSQWYKQRTEKTVWGGEMVEEKEGFS